MSLLMITKDSEELLEKSLKSTQAIADEIVIIDNDSRDKTIEIAKKFQARIFKHDENDLGKKRAFGLNKTRGRWILVLDADEVISEKLSREIQELDQEKLRKKNIAGFYIPYQNHFMGKAINYGGENYKMLRLFRKESVVISPALVHEGFRLKKGEAGVLEHKIDHYSYRSLLQMFAKFTDYGLREAKQKVKRGEKTSFKKIFLYPLHMLWARFVEDKGYKDGIFRIPLDLGFAYMEFLTYFLMLFIRKIKVLS